MLTEILNHIREDQPAAIDRLCDYLKIPSVSTDPAFKEHCQTAARWTANQLSETGLETTIHQTTGHPVVVGQSKSAGPDVPTVLFYGHYDVQPPDPLEKWTTPPFEPTIRENRVYARGSSDDKGQVMCFIEALRAYQVRNIPLPVNVTVLIEGEEECGSVALESFVPQHADILKADIAVVSDTSMWDYGQPAITYALRGLLYFDVKLFGPSRDLHSGVYGGTVPNPATLLTRVLASLFDDDNRVTIPGFYDDVVDLDPAERDEWETLGFCDQVYGKSIGLDALFGEADFSTLERRWARPSCDVNGLYGGYMGEGAKTVIPSFAGGKVSFRLAANQDAIKIKQAFIDWFHANTPAGCTAKIEDHGHAYPVIVPRDSDYLSAAKRAVQHAAGKPPVLVRDGATIPVVSTFKTELGLDTLLIGFGLNDDNLHSPNEKFELENYKIGCLTHAALLYELANPSD